MANAVWHTRYRIKIELSHADLGNPDRPGLIDEILVPIAERERDLLECIGRHEENHCPAEEAGRSPWMTIRQRTVNGVTTFVPAHLPLRIEPTAEESDKHKAMKERIARAAHEHGFAAEVEARAVDGRIRTDVLVTGPGGRVGWEAQYSPIAAATVRRRSTRAVAHGITPLWVTSDSRSALIERTPWVQVDDRPWEVIASRQSMLIRAGARYLQHWKCDGHNPRSCPDTGASFCGRFHAHWDLPALCIPQKPTPGVDDLVITSATGDWVPMRIPNPEDPQITSRMWVPAPDRALWREITAEPEPDITEPEPPKEGELTFTHQPLDTRCRYGEDTHTFNDTRTRRATAAPAARHTWDAVPQ